MKEARSLDCKPNWEEILGIPKLTLNRKSEGINDGLYLPGCGTSNC
jgi:hypothetical protein